MNKCSLCKKDVFKGYYERIGGIDYYYHESCKASSIKQFLDEEGLRMEKKTLTELKNLTADPLDEIFITRYKHKRHKYILNGHLMNKCIYCDKKSPYIRSKKKKRKNEF